MKKILLIIAVIVSISANSQVYKPNSTLITGISSATFEDGTKAFRFSDPERSGMFAWHSNGTLKIQGDTLKVLKYLMEYTMKCFDKFSKPIVIMDENQIHAYNRYTTDTIANGVKR